MRSPCNRKTILWTGCTILFTTSSDMLYFPASALYGPEDEKREKSVTLGFCKGNRMSNENGILKAEGRKQVRVMYFYSLRDINEDQVRALLFEASMIDETLGK